MGCWWLFLPERSGRAHPSSVVWASLLTRPPHRPSLYLSCLSLLIQLESGLCALSVPFCLPGLSAGYEKWGDCLAMAQDLSQKPLMEGPGCPPVAIGSIASSHLLASHFSQLEFECSTLVVGAIFFFPKRYMKNSLAFPCR